MSILKQSLDISQIHAAWMGLTKRLSLAQENLLKYEIQYCRAIPGEDFDMPTSPVSMELGIHEVVEDLDNLDLQMRYLFNNVPHHQDQIKSPRKLRDGASWDEILSLPNNLQGNELSRLPSIVVNSGEEQGDSQRTKGKRRITDEFNSPPTSPHILNVGYSTPFKSSSQFFSRPGGVQLPSSGTMSQQNVLMGLALPNTPAFENILSSGNSYQTQRVSSQIRSHPSNPFKGRPLPPHMEEDNREMQEDLGQSSSAPVNWQRSSSIRNRHPAETRLNGELSWNHLPLGGNCEDPPGGDPDGLDDDDEGDEYSCRNNNQQDPPNNCPPAFPNGGGRGGNPGGGGGGNDLNRNGPHLNTYPQGNIPYGNLVATIRNKLKQEQLLVWDGNKETDIPVALGYWLWKSLKENSRIWMWFTTLPFLEQAKMRTHYLHYLKGIKDNYLGWSWQISMNRKDENQTFRQDGFERESPPAFIVCCIMHT